MALVFLGPRNVPGWPSPSFPFGSVGSLLGAALVFLGSALFLPALFHLGRHLTPLPYPRAGVTLVQTGPFAIVRHPIYSGGLAIAFGWALLNQGWLTLAGSIALFLLLDAKSRREERWLAERLPDYAAYQKRVQRLISFVY
ncbi:MAG: isoprenylcysteine carboxylmethyltransferase family protein [Vicinamibacterales bacterium]